MEPVVSPCPLGPDRAGQHELSYVVVIPTIGRPSLQNCLDALAAAAGPAPQQVVLADDRRDTPDPLQVTVPAPLADRTIIVTLEGRGPAAARNAGWRAAIPSEWVVFLDDDVCVGPDWSWQLAADLCGAAPDVAGVQAIIRVPPPAQSKPTDAERATLGLADAAWITADMAYRRAALTDAGGFDERFVRAFREDSDLALRATALGWKLRRGCRMTTHPLRPGSSWSSLAAQAGNADDAAMSRLHGRHWRTQACATIGRRPSHLVACGLCAATLILLGTRHRSQAALTASGWLAMTAEFTLARIAPGPRTHREITAMAVTSAAIPPLAVGYWVAGSWQHRHARSWPPLPAAVLFDRDGTLVHDVPYNGDPQRVAPVPGAAAAVAALRRAGLKIAVVTNQSGIARGLITREQADAVNRRIDQLVGPFDAWLVCPHDEAEACHGRKPAPGMILQAADLLGVAPADCVVVGDTAADVSAARDAGARAVLVPTTATRPAEHNGVACVASLTEAVSAILAGTRLPSWRSAPDAQPWPGGPHATAATVEV